MFKILRGGSFGNRPHFWGDLLSAGSIATLFSGIPSTLYAVLSGTDPWQAMRAAGAMLIPADSAFPLLLMAAALVHCTISFLWAALLVLILPPEHVILSSLVSAALIGVFDLLIVGQLLDTIYALPFWPQMADHLLWGALLGAILHVRVQGR
jgi:hypothetical protein